MDIMTEVPVPQFPALLVHDDGSVTILQAADTWSLDLDLWYWSDPSEFMVDCNSTRFDQEAVRGADGHPLEPPAWRFTRRLSGPELVEMGFRHLAAEGLDSVALRSVLADASERQIPALLVDYIRSLS